MWHSNIEFQWLKSRPWRQCSGRFPAGSVSFCVQIVVQEEAPKISAGVFHSLSTPVSNWLKISKAPKTKFHHLHRTAWTAFRTSDLEFRNQKLRLVLKGLVPVYSFLMCTVQMAKCKHMLVRRNNYRLKQERLARSRMRLEYLNLKCRILFVSWPI